MEDEMIFALQVRGIVGLEELDHGDMTVVLDRLEVLFKDRLNARDVKITQVDLPNGVIVCRE